MEVKGVGVVQVRGGRVKGGRVVRVRGHRDGRVVVVGIKGLGW